MAIASERTDAATWNSYEKTAELWRNVEINLDILDSKRGWLDNKPLLASNAEVSIPCRQKCIILSINDILTQEKNA